MRGALRALALLSLASGCLKNIPLTEDPTFPGGPKLSPPAVYRVEWYKELSPMGLLEASPSETAQPTVDPDTQRIYVGTRNGLIHALSPSGVREWTFTTGSRTFAGGSMGEGVLYQPSGDVLYALRGRTGELLWKYVAGEEIVTSPVVLDGRLLVMTQNDTLISVDRETGKWQWQYRRETPSGFTIRGASTPVVREGLVYVGFADGALVTVALSDGVEQWERNLSTSGGTQFLDADTTPRFDGAGRVFMASYKEGLFALRSESGDLEWQTQRTGVTSLLQRGEVLFTAGNGELGAVNQRTGKLLWSLNLSDKVSGKRGINAGRAPMFAKGLLIVPTSSALAFVDPARGAVLTAWNPGEGVSATPTRAGDHLYVLSNKGNLYALRLVGGGP